MNTRTGFLLCATGFAWLTLATCGIHASDGEAVYERELDKTFVNLLVEKSSLIIVGEPVEYLMQDRYGLILSANMYFDVKVRDVLRGDKTIKGQIIKVGVQRDEVPFRYEKKNPFLFFMKPHPMKDKGGRDRNIRPDWRVVSDYFGVQPHTLTLERMVDSSIEKED